MSLGGLEALAQSGRQAAAPLRRDIGTITRGGAPTFNSTTGLITDTAATAIYTGPLRVRQPTATESETLFGEEQVTLSRFMVDTPHDTTGVQIDDVVTVTTTDDADLLTRRFRVLSIPMNTFTLYKGYPVELVE